MVRSNALHEMDEDGVVYHLLYLSSNRFKAVFLGFHFDSFSILACTGSDW